MIELLVASDGSDSTAATPASDPRGQAPLSCLLCLDSEVCGELLLFTHRKSID